MTTAGAFREALDARLREPMKPLTHPEVLGKLLPNEPVETVRSTGNHETAAPLWLQDTDRWGLLARYSEITEAIEAGCKAKPFDPFEADKLSKKLHALLGEMAEAGARIRKERGFGR